MLSRYEPLPKEGAIPICMAMLVLTGIPEGSQRQSTTAASLLYIESPNLKKGTTVIVLPNAGLGLFFQLTT